MKTIHLKGITNPMSESEMKNVVGGFDVLEEATHELEGGGSDAANPCEGKNQHDDCMKAGKKGCCEYAPLAGLYCRVPC